MYKYADWDIKVKIVITAIIVFFVFSTYNTDVEPPELILKEDTYIVERENKIDEKTLKNDIIKSVSDNQTNLTNSDVQVIDFDKIDFMKKGTYQVQLKVTDGNDNITEETLIVKVKANKADLKAEKEAEEQAAREAEEQAARQQQVQTPVNQVPESSNPQPYYQNCTDVKYHGAAPIYRGQPGWQDKFDRDGDGVACEV